MNVLDPEKTTRIKNFLRQNPRGMTISALASKLKMNRNLMAKYLDVLLYSGQVEMQVTGTAKVYFISHRVPISAMLEFSSDYILVLDEQARIQQVNTRLLSLLGTSRENLIGKKTDESGLSFLNQIPSHNLPTDLQHFKGNAVEFRCFIIDRQYDFRMKQIPTVFEDGSYGQTLIIEDISERRKNEEQIKTYMLLQEFFSRKLQEFAELSPGADIYAAIGAGFSELLPEAIIDVNIYDPKARMLRLKALFGERSGEFAERLTENHARWDASPAYDFVPEVLGAGTLFQLPGRLHYASFEQLTREVSEEIEREFNLGDFYSIGLTWRGNLLGNILFILRNGNSIQNIPFIEIYARAASIALQRHIAEEAFLPVDKACTSGLS